MRTSNLMRVLACTMLWLAAIAGLSLLGPGGDAARAQTPTPTPIPNYPAGVYTVTLDCGANHSVKATVTFTKDDNPVSGGGG